MQPTTLQSEYYKDIFKVEIFQGRNINSGVVGSNPIWNSEFFSELMFLPWKITNNIIYRKPRRKVTKLKSKFANKPELV